MSHTPVPTPNEVMWAWWENASLDQQRQLLQRLQLPCSLVGVPWTFVKASDQAWARLCRLGPRCDLVLATI